MADQNWHLPLPMTGLKLVLGILCSVSVIGCQSGFKIGSWTIIEPKPPLDANRIEVVLRNANPSQPAGDLVTLRKLKVDLVSGRASLEDWDGRVFPIELHPNQAKRLREGIANRNWRMSKPKPPTNVNRWYVFGMSVFVNDEPLKPVAQWHNHPRKPLPKTLVTVMDIFDVAVRHVHPLSERVNLIE